MLPLAFGLADGSFLLIADSGSASVAALRAFINGWKYLARCVAGPFESHSNCALLTDHDEEPSLCFSHRAARLALNKARAELNTAAAAAGAGVSTTGAAAAAVDGPAATTAAAAPCTEFAAYIHMVHGDDSSDKEYPNTPVSVTGLLEKVGVHLNSAHDKTSGVAKMTFREPGAGSNDSDGVIDEVLLNLVASMPDERPQVIMLEVRRLAFVCTTFNAFHCISLCVCTTFHCSIATAFETLETLETVLAFSLNSLTFRFFP